MNLYLIQGRYVGTQADARAAAKEAGIRFDPEQHSEEVPTDKAGLIAYLNGRIRQQREAPSLRLPATAEDANRRPDESKRDMSAGAILDRIDRQHAEQALRDARAAIDAGLALMKRKHSGEPERVEEEAESLLED